MTAVTLYKLYWVGIVDDGWQCLSDWWLQVICWLCLLVSGSCVCSVWHRYWVRLCHTGSYRRLQLLCEIYWTKTKPCWRAVWNQMSHWSHWTMRPPAGPSQWQWRLYGNGNNDFSRTMRATCDRTSSCSNSEDAGSPIHKITIRYDTIRDAILTCARKPT